MEQENDYLKGFNTGYRLAKFNPELVVKLLPSLSVSNDYENGVIEGTKQLEVEKEKGRLNELDELRSETHKEKNEEKDR